MILSRANIWAHHCRIQWGLFSAKLLERPLTSMQGPRAWHYDWFVWHWNTHILYSYSTNATIKKHCELSWYDIKYPMWLRFEAKPNSCDKHHIDDNNNNHGMIYEYTRTRTWYHVWIMMMINNNGNRDIIIIFILMYVYVGWYGSWPLLTLYVIVLD